MLASPFLAIALKIVLIMAIVLGMPYVAKLVTKHLCRMSGWILRKVFGDDSIDKLSSVIMWRCRQLEAIKEEYLMKPLRLVKRECLGFIKAVCNFLF